MKWLLVCLLAGLCGAQTTFRADVHLVNVSVAVRDSGSKLVDRLTQDDFELLEDGVPQKLAFFARSSDVPLNLGLVVDISGSQAAFLKTHQKDLKVFLDKAVTERDRAFLVCFSANPRLVADYTASSRQLVNALAGFVNVGNKSDYPLLLKCAVAPEVRSEANRAGPQREIGLALLVRDRHLKLALYLIGQEIERMDRAGHQGHLRRPVGTEVHTPLPGVEEVDHYIERSKLAIKHRTCHPGH